MAKGDDLTGQHFGRWTVLGPAGQNRHRQGLWRVRCSCGTETERTAADLKKSGSCGCARAEQLASRNRQRRGLSPRALPARPCLVCGELFEPRTRQGKYCGDACRHRAHWERTAADPEQRARHSRRVGASQKKKTHVPLVCAQCGRDFMDAPTRLHCSRECLDAASASGKYRHTYQRRRLEREAAELAAELEERISHE